MENIGNWRILLVLLYKLHINIYVLVVENWFKLKETLQSQDICNKHKQPIKNLNS